VQVMLKVILQVDDRSPNDEGVNGGLMLPSRLGLAAKDSGVDIVSDVMTSPTSEQPSRGCVMESNGEKRAGSTAAEVPSKAESVYRKRLRLNFAWELPKIVSNGFLP
jgi:hypothetical protein